MMGVGAGNFPAPALPAEPASPMTPVPVPVETTLESEQDKASKLASQNPNQGNGTMTMGSAVVQAPDPSEVGPKVQAFGMPQAGARIPIGALGQGTARPPLPGQMINSTGLIGKQMQPR
jgi:hypothetical protein